jgi:hypothetical protein
MKLITKELARSLPPLYSSESDPDPMVQCKFFFPDFHWTWYGIEFDGEDIFFGFVDGDFPELGYFSLNELVANRGKWGMPVERDRSFVPCRLSELRKRLGR